MDLSQLLIDWDSPDMIKNSKMYDIDLINNPFDVMELEAANKDPFDLVPNQMPVRKDPPCGNLLSPLWEPKVRQIQKSVSLTNLNNLANIIENNYIKFIKDDSMKDESKNSSITMANLYVGGDILNQANTNCTPVNMNKSKIENNQKYRIEPILTQINDDLNIEQISLCNEEEKKQIREQTRQHIKELIEKEKQVYQEKDSRKSLLFCTPKRNTNANKSLFNKGFLNNSSDNSISFDYFHKTPNNKTSNSSSIFSTNELDSFDLNSLKPDWVMDSFIDNNTSMDVQIKDKSVTKDGPDNGSNQVDVKLPLNHIETIESKSNGSKTILNCMQTKRIPNKGPFLANIPLEHMVKMKTEFKPVNSHALSQSKPLASSTPVLDTIAKIKTPSSKSSTKLSRRSLSSQSTSNYIESPKTQLNITKYAKKNLNNTLNDKHRSTNIPVQQKVLCSSNLINRQFKSSVNLFNEAMERKFEIQKSFKLNKSKSESKLGRYQNQ